MKWRFATFLRAVSPLSKLRPETRRDLLIAVTIAGIVGVPAGMAAALQWIEVGSDSATPAEPRWLTPDALRAMTQDGTLVKARVALEPGSGGSQSALRLRLREIDQLLNVSVLAHSREQISGADGLARLTDDMLRRVNRYLVAEGVTPLRSIAIVELVMTRAS